MKKTAGLLLLVLFIAGCSSDEKPFEIYNPEVFSFFLEEDNLWEVNASAQIRGFQQNEENKQFSHHLSFSVDLILPDGAKKEGISTGDYQETAMERLTDLQLEAQFELDSSYTASGYKLVWNVKDELSGKTITKESEFKLSEE
ncbi:MAG: hypothetical protein FMNOHCHN_03098 [Ignavibacteriaceae bacterium]|nr:hypothetical protein [Ignavibacteriaceae bacterium]